MDWNSKQSLWFQLSPYSFFHRSSLVEYSEKNRFDKRCLYFHLVTLFQA